MSQVIDSLPREWQGLVIAQVNTIDADGSLGHY